MTLMKKILLGGAFLVTFVVGVTVSDILLHTINSIFGKEIFNTRIDLEARLAKNRQELEEFQARLEESNRKYDEVSDEMKRKQQALDNLIEEVDTNIDPAVIKDVLLTTPASQSGEQGRIFLKPAGGETILQPTTNADPTINQFKTAFNKKAKEILDVSRGIFQEKIGQVNDELVRMNNELKDKNLELIKQLKEVEKYKQELDEHKKQIQKLEGIKLDLENTVGVLETKIEQGRLRVNFQGDILFASGSHRLREEGMKLLEKVFPILKKSVENHDIFIAGHTDNVPVIEKSQKYKSNWDLSTYRAIEVVKFLIGKGILPQYLTAAGYGEYKPVAGNDTEVGKAKNRRVELYLIPKIIKRTE